MNERLKMQENEVKEDTALTLQNLQDWPMDNLESEYKKSRNQAVADEYFDRCKYLMQTNRDFMRKVFGLYRSGMVAVVDLEATCYGPGERQDLPNEVIEVGWALLDTRTYQVVDRAQWYVRPTLSVVTPFCTSLTGITPEVANAGVSYAELVEQLEKHHKNHPLGPVTTWVSYGEADQHYFDRQSKAENVLRPWASAEYFNMKLLAGLFFGFGKKKNPGLKKAMGLANLEMLGKHHSGTDDAFNTARLLAHMMEKKTNL